MSVVGTKECYESLSPIVKNFSYSMKNKERLDQVMRTLVQHHKHARNKTDTEVLQGIKDSLTNIRQRTLTNTEENIVSQCSEQSFYYAWAALDLRIKDLELKE